MIIGRIGEQYWITDKGNKKYVTVRAENEWNLKRCPIPVQHRNFAPQNMEDLNEQLCEVGELGKDTNRETGSHEKTASFN